METQRISVRIPIELLESIDEIAIDSDSTRTAVVIEALEAFVLNKNAVEIDGPINTALRVQAIEKTVKLINRNILTMNDNISAEQQAY